MRHRHGELRQISVLQLLLISHQFSSKNKAEHMNILACAVCAALLSPTSAPCTALNVNHSEKLLLETFEIEL